MCALFPLYNWQRRKVSTLTTASWPLNMHQFEAIRDGSVHLQVSNLLSWMSIKRATVIRHDITRPHPLMEAIVISNESDVSAGLLVCDPVQRLRSRKLPSSATPGGCTTSLVTPLHAFSRGATFGRAGKMALRSSTSYCLTPTGASTTSIGSG